MAKARQPILRPGEHHLREMERLLRRLGERHQLWTAFEDFVAMSAFSISNAIDPRAYTEREAAYMQIVKRYSTDEVQQFPMIFSQLVLALEAEPQDYLGRLFHALELHNKWRGQYFSPWSLCVCMAQMTVHDAKELLATQPFLTACEPCAGSGAMVLALAEALRDHEINYQQYLHVTAIDIDLRCVHMAYVQMSLLHIPGIVLHGDSLLGETWSTWATPAHILGFWAEKLAHQQQIPAPETSAALLPAPLDTTGEVIESVDDIPLPVMTTTVASVTDELLTMIAMARQPIPFPAVPAKPSPPPSVTVGTQLTLW